MRRPRCANEAEQVVARAALSLWSSGSSEETIGIIRPIFPERFASPIAIQIILMERWVSNLHEDRLQVRRREMTCSREKGGTWWGCSVAWSPRR